MFKLEIDTSDSAFRELTPYIHKAEIARILRDTAIQIEAGKASITLYDINGNRVGDANWIVD